MFPPTVNRNSNTPWTPINAVVPHTAYRQADPAQHPGRTHNVISRDGMGSLLGLVSLKSGYKSESSGEIF